MQRAMPIGQICSAAGEQEQPLPEAVEQLLRAEKPNAGRDELDRKGEAIETSAQLGHSGGVRRVEPEPWPHGLRVFDEELDSGFRRKASDRVG